MKQCIDLCKSGPFKNVVHVGAHLGEEAQDYMNNGVETVAWFEGNPELIPELKNKTQPFKKMTQHYLNACLSDVEEELLFNIANNGQSSSILKLGTHAKLYPHISYIKSIKVMTQRMDKLELPFDVSSVDFLNLDVQGAELKVLKGFGNLLKSSNLRAIYTEVNSEHVYEECCLVGELDKFLKQFGFKRIAVVAPEKAWGDGLYSKMR